MSIPLTLLSPGPGCHTIVPPYNSSKVLPVARLLHAGKTTGVSPDAEEEEEPSDNLLEEIGRSPSF